MTRSDLESHIGNCPYCGEPIETVLDLSAGSQQYVEDCPICCRPIEYRLEINPTDDVYQLTLHRDDE